MREKSKLFTEIIAQTFKSVNNQNAEKGINIQYKYKKEKVEEDLFVFTIIISQLGHKDKELTSFRFKKPSNIDKFTFEYQANLEILSNIFHTGLLTWFELAKNLNTDKKFQEVALKAEPYDKANNKNT